MATTTATLLNNQSTSSTSSLFLTIFSLISIASSLSALYFFSKTTTFYNSHFVSHTYIFSTAFIALHPILVFFHRNLLNAKILEWGFIKYIKAPITFFVIFDLYFFPEKTVNGLLFVICIWIDVYALMLIMRPVVEQVDYLPSLILMVIVDRTIHLYGFFALTGWMIVLCCLGVIYVMDFLGNKIYVNVPDETKEDMEQ